MPTRSPRPAVVAAVQDVAVAAGSTCAATVVTNPLDVIKVRLQLDSLRGVQGGPVRTALTLVRSEGLGALWAGTPVALLRAGTYGGARLGLYPPIKAALISQHTGRATPSEPPAALRVSAGMISGGIGSILTSPLELLKVRQQMHPDALPSSTSSSSGQSASRRPSVLVIFRDVVKAGGVRALWAGATPSVYRGALLTASQCVCYEESKSVVTAFMPGLCVVATHFWAAMLTGLVSTTVTNPVDVIKQHQFARPKIGLIECAKQLIQNDGIGALLRGWSASYVRIGPHTVLIFVFNERLRQLAGMDAL